ncbi:MAG: zinc ribbon domain-containing protein [Thermodesulfobacteriota bacterium]|nr:zinc ribbon domain-containing protein [Thermodesulfobacteriota bacterium]
MPIYEYHCDKCEHDFEEIVFSSSAEVACPKCRNTKVKKQMSVSSFKSGGEFSSSTGPSCSGCSSTNCSTCH